MGDTTINSATAQATISQLGSFKIATFTGGPAPSVFSSSLGGLKTDVVSLSRSAIPTGNEVKGFVQGAQAGKTAIGVTGQATKAVAGVAAEAAKTPGGAFKAGFNASLEFGRNLWTWGKTTALPNTAAWLGESGGGAGVGRFLSSAGRALSGIAGRVAPVALGLGVLALAGYGIYKIVQGAARGIVGSPTNITINK
jgi:hypothetical protein